jgi:hypothetical protein
MGTNSGPSGTGNHVRISGYEDWRIGPDGLIADSKGHYDARDWDRQSTGRASGGSPGVLEPQNAGKRAPKNEGCGLASDFR